ncbi:hypothetical protein PR202_gb27201 [Eleusine coracana subsp. coracana]|uniref:Arabidopsis retrotransposon Orf1 C-terminal domain-containing protein n=1 Tax=Eleusine coracana subsp. coracana TaxID=191504 RepID=A0AAV5FTS7_ELECO|nr:hypothetical protein PR202_gb27201 [Eleusine coracana subsp. coracana]
MWEDLRRMLDNLGWMDFHLLPMDYNLDVVTEVGSTMRLGTVEDGSEAVNFRVRDISHTVTMEAVAQAFGLDVGADVAGILGRGELDSIWRWLSFIEEMKRGNIRNLTIQVFHRRLAACIGDKVDSSNVTDADLRWLFNAIVSPSHCNPMSVMVRGWLDKRGKASKKLAFGAYLQRLAALIYDSDGPGGRNDKWECAMEIGENTTRGNIVTGSVRANFHVGGTNIKLPCVELGVFLPRKLEG